MIVETLSDVHVVLRSKELQTEANLAKCLHIVSAEYQRTGKFYSTYLDVRDAWLRLQGVSVTRINLAR